MNGIISNHETEISSRKFFSYIELIFLLVLSFVVYEAHRLPTEIIEKHIDFLRMTGIFAPWVGIWRYITNDELFSFILSISIATALFYLF